MLRVIFFSLIALLFLGFIEGRSERVKKRDEILFLFSKEMKKEGLYPIGQGGGCDKNNKTNLITITYSYADILNIKKLEG